MSKTIIYDSVIRYYDVFKYNLNILEYNILEYTIIDYSMPSMEGPPTLPRPSSR